MSPKADGDGTVRAVVVDVVVAVNERSLRLRLLPLLPLPRHGAERDFGNCQGNDDACKDAGGDVPCGDGRSSSQYGRDVVVGAVGVFVVGVPQVLPPVVRASSLFSFSFLSFGRKKRGTRRFMNDDDTTDGGGDCGDDDDDDGTSDTSAASCSDCTVAHVSPNKIVVVSSSSSSSSTSYSFLWWLSSR